MIYNYGRDLYVARKREIRRMANARKVEGIWTSSRNSQGSETISDANMKDIMDAYEEYRLNDLEYAY